MHINNIFVVENNTVQVYIEQESYLFIVLEHGRNLNIISKWSILKWILKQWKNSFCSC